MRALIQSADLATALKSSAAPGNSPHDLLMHARLQTLDNAIVVETTDTEVWMRTTIPAEVRTPGSVLLRESLLRPVAAVPGEIALSADGHLVRGRSKFRVPALGTDGWPEQEESKWSPVQVDGQALAIAIASVTHAATDEDIRPALKGVHLADGCVWASDARSVGFVRVDYSGPAITIPANRVRQALAVLGEGATLQISHVREGVAGGLRITRGLQQFSLRLLGHKSIAIRDVIKGFRYSDQPMVIKRDPLLAATKRFMPFALALGPAARKSLPTIVMESDGTGLTIADRMEESRESLDDEVTHVGGKFRGALDPSRMIAALGAVDSDSVTVHPPQDGVPGSVFAFYATNADPADEAHYVAQFTI